MKLPRRAWRALDAVRRRAAPSFPSGSFEPQSLAVVHWPSGVDELFVGDSISGIYRVVLDASHNPVGNATYVSFSHYDQIIAAP